MTDFLGQQREQMVWEQLKSRDIQDERVLQAFLEIPRHLFVPTKYQSMAYEDHPVDIGENQTISQPYMVALMTQSLQLKGHEKVLEIGTGSGYQTAILSKLCSEVVTVERISDLSKQAQERLKPYSNITFIVGDGTEGLVHLAPYHGILVTAAGPEIPHEYVQQLIEGGRLVMPVGSLDFQELLLGRKERGKLITSSICGCRFVPLLGRKGWRS